MSVLAVFDVRGIQEFIFRTNKIKEIIGASEIVKDILRVCFEKACEDVFGKSNTEKMDFDWENKIGEYDFDKSDFEVEIIYEGGGNLYAAFKDEENYKRVYRKMNEIILDKTYSLSVSSACVKCEENYRDDIDRLMKNINEAKQNNPPLTIPRGIAVTKRDTNTGLPLVMESDFEKKEKDLNKTNQKIGEEAEKEAETKKLEKKYISTETKLKLEKYIDYLIKLKKKEQESNQKQVNTESKQDEQEKNFRYMLNLDEMVTDKGTESLLAIVHIDGNNMAHAITENMKAQKKYNEAVPKIRELSQIIIKSFTLEAYNVMPEELEKAILKNVDWKELDINKDYDKPKLPMRPIICAGDDITFICNARVAIPLTKLYLEKIINCPEGKSMEFSACAGIAFIHSHFPFNLAYKIAEECCSNAKAEAKLVPDVKKRGFIDFHFCFSGVTGDLESMRENQYINKNGYSLLRRPWQVTGDKIDSLKDIKMLEEFAEYFSTGKTPNEKTGNSDKKDSIKNYDNSDKPNIDKSTEKSDGSNSKKQLKAWTNSRVAEFRNLYFSSEEALRDAIKQYKSRGYELPKYQKYLNEDIDTKAENDVPIELFYADGNDSNFKAIYYDSIEISDIYSSIDDFAANFIKNKFEAQKRREKNQNDTLQD